MSTLITLLVGAIGGFLFHALSMKISFKQRTIDDKIKVYASLISAWVEMRNFVYQDHYNDDSAESGSDTLGEFDQMYGQTQKLIGEFFLICEDRQLANDVNALNERFYREPGAQMGLDKTNISFEELKVEALRLIERMQGNINESTRITLSDFLHIFSGFWQSKQAAN